MNKCLLQKTAHRLFLLEQKAKIQRQLEITNDRAMKLCSPGKKHSPACIALYDQIQNMREEVNIIQTDLNFMDSSSTVFDFEEELANRYYDC